MNKFYTASFGAIAEGDTENPSELKHFESDYIKKYRDNVMSIAQNRDWKYSAADSPFGAASSYAYEDLTGEVKDVCAYDDDECIYTARVGQVSAIVKKNLKNNQEVHIIHSNSQVFGSLEYNKADKKILTSVSAVRPASNIAVFDEKISDLKVMTDGDSVDEYPSFSKTDDRVLFSSRGIGRNAALEVAAFSPSEILSIDPYGNIQDVLKESGYDLLAPKNDKDGNLYYLRKPAQKIKKGKSFFGVILDIILLPFWLVYGIVKLLIFLASIAKNSSKKDKDKNNSYTGGNNPALNKTDANKTLYVYGEEIDFEKQEKKRQKDEDGFAPSHFELYKMTAAGNKEKIRGGVLSFDIKDDGTLIYTNGKSVFYKPVGGDEKKLCKDDVVLRAKMGGFSKNTATADPFSN